MKVLSPINTTHVIKGHPRFIPTSELSMRVTKEGYNTFQDVVLNYTINNGVMSLYFYLSGSEGEKYTVKLTQNNIICYRCKVLFTAQDPQSYQQTKNEYIYAG